MADQLPLGIVPRPWSNTATRIDRARAGTSFLAEVRVPCTIAGAGSGGEILADLIRAREPAEIARARRRAGNEETHRLLRLLALSQHGSGTEQVS